MIPLGDDPLNSLSFLTMAFVGLSFHITRTVWRALSPSFLSEFPISYFSMSTTVYTIFWLCLSIGNAKRADGYENNETAYGGCLGDEIHWKCVRGVWCSCLVAFLLHWLFLRLDLVFVWRYEDDFYMIPLRYQLLGILFLIFVWRIECGPTVQYAGTIPY